MLTLSPQRGRRHRDVPLRVLTYHRVADPRGSELFDPRLISSTPAVFAKQMEYLARAGCAVPIESVVQAVTEGGPLPHRATLITFDDGYFDLAQHAFPTLQRLGLPAVVFVPTAYPDQPERIFWWDRLYRALRHSPRREVTCGALGPLPLGAWSERTPTIRRVHDHLKQLPPDRRWAALEELCHAHGERPVTAQSVLSWDELRAWAARGIAVASHSRTHPLLTQLPAQEAAAEIAGGQEDVQREMGYSHPVFCYPNGSVNADIVALLRGMGFVLGFTTESGGNNLARCEPLRLRRQSVYPRSVLPIFRFRLTRLGAAVDAWRHARPTRVYAGPSS